MGLQVGIVGLPNVGKSSLFQALTASDILIANYPFATVQPNVGMVAVPDPRLQAIAQIFQPRQTTPAIVEFVDIAGLIKGAHHGEGLGNAFLAQIRETDLICLVTRGFTDRQIVHVSDTIDPVQDVETVMIELMMADQTQLKKRFQKLKSQLKANQKQANLKQESMLVQQVLTTLNNNQWLNLAEFEEHELKLIQSWNLFTAKPVLIAVNVNESAINNYATTATGQKLITFCTTHRFPWIPICAKLEAELSSSDADDHYQLLQDLYGIQPGLQRLIQECYQKLGLATFFTAGPKEVRAWTFRQGMLAPDCAGIIHSDFIKHFIRVEVYNYDNLMACQSEKIVRQKGLMRVEGKNYQIQDGDICYFRTSA